MEQVEDIFDSVEKLERHFKSTQDRSVILFADLSNSTEYKQKRLFVNGLYKTKIHNDVVTGIVNKHGGRVVKYIGDATMCEFVCNENNNCIHEAINLAIEILESFLEYNKSIYDELEQIQTKIGLAYGSVVYFYGNDPQGKVVDLAARIESNAKPNQILIHKLLKDSCDLSKINSNIGKALKYQAESYFSDPIKLKFKGIPEPQEILEVKACNSFKGIKTENEYFEYWKNYRFEAYLSKIEDSFIDNAFIKDNYFKIVYDLRYETVPNRDTFWFVCTGGIEEFNKTMQNSNLFSRYNLPPNEAIIENLSKIFKVDFFEVNEIKLAEMNVQEKEKESSYFTQCFKNTKIPELIGKEVSIRYRISTIINKYAHFYHMTTAYPIQNLSMVFKFGDTEISKIWAVDVFSSGNIPKYTYTPSKDSPKEIEVTIGNSEWIYPRSGVVFIWRLSSEGVKKTEENISSLRNNEEAQILNSPTVNNTY